MKFTKNGTVFVGSESPYMCYAFKLSILWLLFNIGKKSIDILPINDDLSNPVINLTEDENHLYYICNEGMTICTINPEYDFYIMDIIESKNYTL